MSVAWLMERALAAFGPPWVSQGELANVRFRQPLRPDVTYTIRAEQGSVGGDQAAISAVAPDGTPAVTAIARLRS
jgi:hypothetical protein